jgi:hypothetical protein
VAAVVGKAIEAKPIVEAPEQHDIVLEPHVGMPPTAATASATAAASSTAAAATTSGETAASTATTAASAATTATSAAAAETGTAAGAFKIGLSSGTDIAHCIATAPATGRGPIATAAWPIAPGNAASAAAWPIATGAAAWPIATGAAAWPVATAADVRPVVATSTDIGPVSTPAAWLQNLIAAAATEV